MTRMSRPISPSRLTMLRPVVVVILASIALAAEGFAVRNAPPPRPPSTSGRSHSRRRRRRRRGWTMSRTATTAVAALGNGAADDCEDDVGGPDADDMAELRRRIESLSASEAAASADFEGGLRRRVRDVAAADAAESDLAGRTRGRLPVVALEPLLPRQRLSGTTTDPVFSRLLVELGLGGLFVMTSVNRRQRLVRRSGVVVRVELVDVDKDVRAGGTAAAAAVPLSGPTAVRFALVGRRRCRVVGPARDMVGRVGRWRVGYDPDGEGTALGWGEERFTDSVYGGAVEVDADADTDVLKHEGDAVQLPQSNRHTDWSTVEVYFAPDDANDDGDEDKVNGGAPYEELVARATSILPLLDRWVALVSDPATFDNNVDVVVSSSRRRRGEGRRGPPAVDASRFLRTALKDLGDRPSPTRPTALAFWGAALINPLPPLGVAPEIRGAMLEAANADRRLRVLERGLTSSIENLEGTAPLLPY